MHTPYSKAVTVEENALVTDTKYVYPGVGFELTSTVRNEGTSLIDKPVTFKFTMTANGETTDLGERTVEDVWGASKTLSAAVSVPALESVSDDLKFNEEITVGRYGYKSGDEDG